MEAQRGDSIAFRFDRKPQALKLIDRELAHLSEVMQYRKSAREAMFHAERKTTLVTQSPQYLRYAKENDRSGKATLDLYFSLIACTSRGESAVPQTKKIRQQQDHRRRRRLRQPGKIKSHHDRSWWPSTRMDTLPGRRLQGFAEERIYQTKPITSLFLSLLRRPDRC